MAQGTQHTEHSTRSTNRHGGAARCSRGHIGVLGGVGDLVDALRLVEVLAQRQLLGIRVRGLCWGGGDAAARRLVGGVDGACAVCRPGNCSRT